jgi:hypothetical protein
MVEESVRGSDLLGSSSILQSIIPLREFFFFWHKTQSNSLVCAASFLKVSCGSL